MKPEKQPQYPQRLPNLLGDWIAKHGYTVADLATASQCSVKHAKELLSGRRMMSVDAALQVEAAWQLPAEKIMTEIMLTYLENARAKIACPAIAEPVAVPEPPTPASRVSSVVRDVRAKYNGGFLRNKMTTAEAFEILRSKS